jgi:hypothetical protein
MNKFEQLVEFIINEDEAKAQELFHEIVVEKSREIYNQLVKEADETDDFVSDIESDEDGDNMDMDDMGMGDMDDEDDMEADDHHSDMGGNEEVEDRIVDLEAALDELKAEFDAMMAGDDDEMEADDDDVKEADDFDFFGEAEEDEDEDEDDMVREYVEKVAAPKGEDHKATSPVAGKNDMGGTTANMVKGGTENGRTAPKPQQMTTGNRNVPGGSASNLEKAPAPKRGE